MSYATPAEFLKRYDARIVGDLVRDNDEQATAAELIDDDNLQAALDDASADIDSALMFGERYTPSDLSGLTGNSQTLLIRMTCDIAMAFLLRRRPSKDADKDAARLELAEKHLERLRKGEQVFYRGEGVDHAGVIDTTGPSVVQLTNLNLIRDRTKNYYPERRLPFNR